MSIQLGDLRDKIFKIACGQSVSLLNQLKQDCYHRTLSHSLLSIELAKFESLTNCVKSIYYPSTQSCKFQACHANPST